MGQSCERRLGLAPDRLPSRGLGPWGWLRWVARRPHCPALLFGRDQQTLDSVTWGELAWLVSRAAARLEREGFRRGDRWVHALGNSPAGVVAMLASLTQGVVEVPLDPGLPLIEKQRLAAGVGGRCLSGDWSPSDVVGPKVSHGGGRSLSRQPSRSATAILRRLLEAAHSEPTGLDLVPALILHTSGSLGSSKPVALSRQNLLTNAQAKLGAVPQGSDDLRLTLLPIWHAYARTCDLGTWLLSGCRLAIGLGWEGWQCFAPRVRPTLVNTVPSLASRLLEQPEASPQFGRLKLLGCGGAALLPEDYGRLRRRGIAVIQGYGLTEASPVICSATVANSRVGYVGRPVQGWETRIDTEGRLSVRGPGVMLGYWNQRLERPEPLSDSWLDTGDLVEVDADDGQYRIVGRADDRITLSNGRKVDPGPIERRVQAVAGVRHAFVMGRGRHLEIWLDLEPTLLGGQDGVEQVKACLEEFPAWQRPRLIRVMPRPLGEVPHALTAKGTLIRKRVLQWINGEGWFRPVGGDRPGFESAR